MAAGDSSETIIGKWGDALVKQFEDMRDDRRYFEERINEQFKAINGRLDNLPCAGHDTAIKVIESYIETKEKFNSKIQATKSEDRHLAVSLFKVSLATGTMLIGLAGLVLVILKVIEFKG